MFSDIQGFLKQTQFKYKKVVNWAHNTRVTFNKVALFGLYC